MPHKKKIATWIGFLCFLVFMMVVVGGITRLTGSGLSMVEWKPVYGILPPLNEEAWQSVFEKYKQFPQYQKVNKGMSLTEFKFIFFWEYLHRVLGRIVGLAFFVPFVFFLLKGALSRPLSIKLFFGFVLGGLQGLMGWYMVKSGLVDIPAVSHYRLAAHLFLAFIIFGYLFWILLDVLNDRADQKLSKLHLNPAFWPSVFLTGLVSLQVVYGAFVAGRKAGYGFNTFPDMHGQWIPASAFALNPAWLNFFENNVGLQFTHRTLAWVLVLALPLFIVWARKWLTSASQKTAASLILVTLLIQFILGVATLLLVIPVSLAVAHQAGALLLFAAMIYMNHSLTQSSANKNA